jgi:methionine-rich copper-binding protein CopC
VQHDAWRPIPSLGAGGRAPGGRARGYRGGVIHSLALAAVATALVLPMPLHATIVGTNPEDGSTISTLPDAFAVTANEEIVAIEGSSSNVILITDQDGAYYGDGCTTVEGATLSTSATLGEAGVYTMRYGLVSADGHPIEGVSTFAWEPEAGATAAAGAAQAPVCGEAAPSASPSAEPSATAEPGATAEPSAAASEPPSSTTAPSASPSADEGDGDEGGLPALAYVGIGLALLAAVAAVLVITWRRGLRREHGADEPRDPDAR